MATPDSKTAYMELFDQFMAIKDEDIVHCTMPLEIATSEARTLARVVARDYKKLVLSGIDPILLDTVFQRAEAFTFAAAAIDDLDPELVRQWKELAPAGYELQKYLFKMFTFAYRKDKTQKKAVANIKKGRGDKDMIMDMLALWILGTENPEPLNALPVFDPTKLQEAKDLHEKLSELYARATIDPKEVNKRRNILNHAYTFYKQAADEIKEHGQFMFEGTEFYRSYVSEYHRNLGKMAHKDAPKAEDFDIPSEEETDQGSESTGTD